MKIKWDKWIISIFLLFFGIAVCWAEHCEVRAAEEDANEGRIVIESNSMEMDNAKRTVTFTGEVKARQDDFSIECQEMVVFYQSEGTRKEAVSEGNRIEKIVATGNVAINRAEGGTARSDKAIYYDTEQKIVLTGNPVARQGKDSVEGDKIVIFLEDRRSVVESSGGGKVKAVINPQGKK